MAAIKLRHRILVTILLFMPTTLQAGMSDCGTVTFQTDFHKPKPVELEMEPEEVEKAIDCLADKQMQASAELQETYRNRLETVRNYLQFYRRLKAEEQMLNRMIGDYHKQMEQQNRLLEVQLPSLAIIVISRQPYSSSDDRSRLEKELMDSNREAVEKHLQRLMPLAPKLRGTVFKTHSSAPAFYFRPATAYLLNTVKVSSTENLKLAPDTINIDNTLILGRRPDFGNFPAFRELARYQSEIEKRLRDLQPQNDRLRERKENRAHRIEQSIQSIEKRLLESTKQLIAVQEKLAEAENRVGGAEAEGIMENASAELQQKLDRLIAHPPTLAVAKGSRYWEDVSIEKNVQGMVDILWSQVSDRMEPYSVEQFQIMTRWQEDSRGVVIEVVFVAAANLIESQLLRQ